MRWIFKNINEIDFKGLVKYWTLCRNYMYSYSKKKKKRTWGDLLEMGDMYNRKH